jgi:hypothetical protein
MVQLESLALSLYVHSVTDVSLKLYQERQIAGNVSVRWGSESPIFVPARSRSGIGPGSGRPEPVRPMSQLGRGRGKRVI